MDTEKNLRIVHLDKNQKELFEKKGLEYNKEYIIVFSGSSFEPEEEDTQNLEFGWTTTNVIQGLPEDRIAHYALDRNYLYDVYVYTLDEFLSDFNYGIFGMETALRIVFLA